MKTSTLASAMAEQPSPALIAILGQELAEQLMRELARLEALAAASEEVE